MHSAGKIMKGLSVYYIVKNEEARLGASLLQSKKLCSDIVVVDSGSTDRTLEIANAAGARTSFNAWRGFAIQKAHAASLCNNDWVLEIDADEVLSDELISSIKKVMCDPDLEQFAGFEILLKHVRPFPGHPLWYSPPMKIMRLYNRRRAKILAIENTIDDRAKVIHGKVGKLHGVLYHRPVMSLEQMERKYLVLSSDQASEFFLKGRKISSMRLFIEFPAKFIKYYFFKGNILNGWYGFVVSMIAANRHFMKLAKAKEKGLR